MDLSAEGTISFTLLGVLLILNCVDALLTIYAIRKGHKELNPLLKAKTISEFEDKIILLKSLAFGALIVIYLISGISIGFMAGGFLVSLFYAGVVGWNLSKLHEPQAPPTADEIMEGML
jgi:hypothetical protein